MLRVVLLLCLFGICSTAIIPNELDVSMPSQTCIHCLCLQESGCKNVGCQEKNGKTACGYFLIDLPYYMNCDQVGRNNGEEVVTAWKRCAADLTCSSQCVKNYYKKTAPNCGSGETPCEILVRNHEGGPYGCFNQSNYPIWAAVKKCCTGQC